MGTNPKNDRLADMTEHGLCSSALPSSSMREVRRAREAEEFRREDLKPEPYSWVVGQFEYGSRSA